MNWIIDRIENSIAVCELDAGKTLDVPVSALPEGVKEGDVISLSVNNEETRNRKEKINNLMRDLFKD